MGLKSENQLTFIAVMFRTNAVTRKKDVVCAKKSRESDGRNKNPPTLSACAVNAN